MKLSKQPGFMASLSSDPSKIKIAIIKAKFNYEITEEMENLAIDRLKELGVKNISSYEVPGSYELPYAANKIIDNYDGAIVIGCLIKGETDHYEYISDSVSHAIQDVIIESKKPIIFGVLTTDTMQQALERAGIKNNLGWSYALQALEMGSLMKAVS